jgi:hypothetical protein
VIRDQGPARVIGFVAPFVAVKRTSDQLAGNLKFRHYSRVCTVLRLPPSVRVSISMVDIRIAHLLE